MTNKSRYFLIGASTVLLVGLGSGIIAYYAYNRVPAVSTGLPTELEFVPATAELVAYVDVQAVMTSELRRELERTAGNSGPSRQNMDDFAGINLEKQVHHIVGYLEAMDSTDQGPPRGVMLVQGTFEQPRVEQFIREHGGTIEEYRGKRIAIRRLVEGARGGRGGDGQPPPEAAVGFVRPDLIAFGQADLVRKAIDVSTDATGPAANVTANAEVMGLVRDTAGETVWVVGHFDAVSRRIGIPSSLSQQVPPLRMVAAKARINGGIEATIKAQTADQTAADQMRDVIRGFVSLIRLQAGARPELQSTLKTIVLGGTGSTVELSFAVTPGAVRAMIPQRRQAPGQPPAMPPPPAPR